MFTDPRGLDRYITQFDLLGEGGTGKTQIHVGIAVDKWVQRPKTWLWRRDGQVGFHFGTKWRANDCRAIMSSIGNTIRAVCWVAVGEVAADESGQALEHLGTYVTMKSSPAQDREMIRELNKQIKNPPGNNALLYNCIWWSVAALNLGMDAKGEGPEDVDIPEEAVIAIAKELGGNPKVGAIVDYARGLIRPPDPDAKD
jgi:hypothetical protein